jgi:hypothetical protein
MPNIIRLKKSSVANKKPVMSDLSYGELALNYADGYIYYRNSSDNILAVSSPNLYTVSGDTELVNNALFDGTNWKYAAAGAASLIEQSAGKTTIYTAASGIAGNTVSFSTTLVANENGNVVIAGTSDAQLDGIGGLLVGNSTRSTTGIGVLSQYCGYVMYADASSGSFIYWDTFNNTERGRWNSSGFFKASNTGSYTGNGLSPSGAYHQFVGNQSGATALVASHSNIGTNGVVFETHASSSSQGYHMQGVASGTVTFRVLSNGNVLNTNNSYGAISDQKLIENVTNTGSALASLNNLRVVNFNFIGSANTQTGLIAQEVEPVFPKLVSSIDDVDPISKVPLGTVTKTVAYSSLIPLLVKGLQEADTKVNGSFIYTLVISNSLAAAKSRIIFDTGFNTPDVPITITLPASPTQGDWIEFADRKAFGESTNTLIVARNGNTIENLSENMLVTESGNTFTLIFSGTTWRVK